MRASSSFSRPSFSATTFGLIEMPQVGQTLVIFFGLRIPQNLKYAEKIVSGLGLRMMCEEVSRRYDLDFLQFFYLEHVLVSAN